MRNILPAKTPPLSSALSTQLASFGEQIRLHRKALKISATAAAEAAGMSRVTWHRIESGEASVTIGAYANAMSALGLPWGVQTSARAKTSLAVDTTQWIPVRVRLSDYAELKKLAWQVHGTDELTPVEALSIYERNARHLDVKSMSPHERDLLTALRAALGNAQHAGPRDV